LSAFDATVLLEAQSIADTLVVESSPELDSMFGQEMAGQNLADFLKSGKDQVLKVLNDAYAHNVESDSQFGQQPMARDIMTLRALVTFEGVQQQLPYEFDCELRTVSKFNRPGRYHDNILCGLHLIGESRPLTSMLLPNSVPNVSNMFRTFRAFGTVFSSERSEQWYLVPGTRYQVPGARYLPGTRYTVPSTCHHVQKG